MTDKRDKTKDYSLDDVCKQFERYRKHCNKQLERSKKRVSDICRSHMTDLEKSLRQITISGEDDIELLQPDIKVLGGNGDGVGDGADVPQAKNDKETDEEEPLVIACGSSDCLFENCHRRLDSQLLLLHYLYDHNKEIAATNRCHQVREGERAKLFFEPRSCQFKQNQIIGLLAYAGTLLQKQEQLLKPPSPTRSVYNSLLPEPFAHMKGDVPVVVLICKTTVLLRKRKKPAHRLTNPKEHVFVIWLVTPNEKLPLNATMCLCGRDAAIQASTIVAVRQVRSCQDSGRFMHVDENHWRLSFEEMQKISNDFRDELCLEVSFTQPNVKDKDCVD